MPVIYSAKGRTVPIKKVDEVSVKRKLVHLPKPEGHFFSAFLAHPTNVRFETQEDKEEIILLLRQHPIKNVPWIIAGIILILIPLYVLPFYSFSFIPMNYRIMIILFWYLLTFAFIFERFLLWFFNLYIVTDEKVIDIDFPTLLYRDIKEAKIGHIEEVSSKVGGYLRSLFNFGAVHIQTAGAIAKIIFEDIPNPARVTKMINQLMDDIKQEELKGVVR